MQPEGWGAGRAGTWVPPALRALLRTHPHAVCPERVPEGAVGAPANRTPGPDLTHSLLQGRVSVTDLSAHLGHGSFLMT